MRNTEYLTRRKKKSFYVIGLNYRKTDVKTRGLFSLDASAKTAMLIEAKDKGIPSLSILTTCNRTELYGISENPFQLIKLLCKYAAGKLEDFDRLGYVYKEGQAIHHTFLVGTGLDSQIIGDFEVISQLRNSFKAAKEEGILNTYMERLVNTVVQASKRVKNETDLSSGAASVSFAAVQYMMKTIPRLSEKNILLFGTGEIGQNTVENLVKHIDYKDIILINRTRSRAEEIGGKFNLQVRGFKSLEAEVQKADILIVATGAQRPTITRPMLKGREKSLLILDLSVPHNVAGEVDQLEEITRVDVDELSQLTRNTLAHRRAEIPKAEEIIGAVKQEFLEWVHVRRFSPLIRALKEKFTTIKDNEIAYQSKKMSPFDRDQAEALGDRIVQKIISQFASYLRTNDTPLEESLEMITQVFHLDLKE